MVGKILSIGKIIINVWDKACNYYMKIKYGSPVVIFKICTESNSPHFYLNADSTVYEVKVRNFGLKCEYLDNSYKSKNGDNKFLLHFKECGLLDKKEEVIPVIDIPSRGMCPVSNNMLRPFNIDELHRIEITYKDKYKKPIITKMKVSWAGKTELEPTD